MKSFFKLLTTIFIINVAGSCSTSSAASEELHGDSLSDTYAYLTPEAIVYASSISNLVSTFPKFRNDAVNREVGVLKNSLTDYLTAIRNFNQSDKHRSLEGFEKAYKKIQKLRKFLITDDDEVLNRYMVKIKTNMNLLEASLNKNMETTSMSSN
ncbi:chitosanase [Epilithonimonas zeae]|uniref:Glycosyl hydrolase family 46 n=1 Tax=Epilithonimonas zeae TaxID=1416779 RepID=A0A1N6JRQ3_9FLAO|nr:chitosanase [Epilithonimonas zeae]SIO46827.1 Glycosyl hydrolase family 46 [Epilithonimonas zeae]